MVVNVLQVIESSFDKLRIKEKSVLWPILVIHFTHVGCHTVFSGLMCLQPTCFHSL